MIPTYKQTVWLYFIGDSQKHALDGMGFDDYDDAVEACKDNGYSQVWEAEFHIAPTSLGLVREFQYDEEGFLVEEDYQDYYD